MDRLRGLVESRWFDLTITWLIVINAVTLGLETSQVVMAEYGALLHLIDHALLAVFVVELLAKIAIYRTAFFRDPWRIFDFLVVGHSLLPASGPLSILRALRVLRVLRLVSIIPSMRRVVAGLFLALPSMGSIFLLLMLFFYVFSVMATKLYGADFPVYFGNIAASAFHALPGHDARGLGRRDCPAGDGKASAGMALLPALHPGHFVYRAQPVHRYYRIGHADRARGGGQGRAGRDGGRNRWRSCANSGRSGRNSWNCAARNTADQSIAPRKCLDNLRPWAW